MMIADGEVIDIAVKDVGIASKANTEADAARPPARSPVVGAGLPGLVMAIGGFLGWRRRKASLAA